MREYTEEENNELVRRALLAKGANPEIAEPLLKVLNEATVMAAGASIAQDEGEDVSDVELYTMIGVVQGIMVSMETLGQPIPMSGNAVTAVTATRELLLSEDGGIAAYEKARAKVEQQIAEADDDNDPAYD